MCAKVLLFSKFSMYSGTHFAITLTFRRHDFVDILKTAFLRRVHA